jgi:hypothetical protein
VAQHRGEDACGRGGFEPNTHRGGENISLTKLHKSASDDTFKFNTTQLGKQSRGRDNRRVFGIGSDNKEIHTGSVEDQQFGKRYSGCGRKPLSEVEEAGGFGTIGRPRSELLDDRIVDSGGKGAHPYDHGDCSDDKTKDEANDARNDRENCGDDQSR